MTLRSLYEKATGGEWHLDPDIYKNRGFNIYDSNGRDVCCVNYYSGPNDGPNVRLIVALHNCADELLKVAEAAEVLMEHVMPISCNCAGCANMRAALRALREKAGKL